MITKNATILNKTGLHARPAGCFAQKALQHKCNVLVLKGNRQFNGKSIISILSACVKCGDTITLVTDGPDEQEAMDDIVAAIESGLGE